MKYYFVKDVINKTNINRYTLRYYEQIGLVVPDSRNEVGYKLYSDQTIENIHLITRLKELDFNLKEIKEIILSLDVKLTNCNNIESVIKRKIEDIRSEIERLENIKSHLQTLCPIRNNKYLRDRCDVINQMLNGGNKILP